MPELELKVRAPLQLELQDGEKVSIQHWSQSGVTFPKETDVLPKKGQLTIPFQGVDIRFAVAFTKGEGPYDLNFKNLSGRQREIIGVFYRSLLSGKMVGSADMITSLDTPVDLVPIGETEEEEEIGKAKAPPRVLRIVWNVLFYCILAVTLFGLIGGQILNRLSSVPFANGRVVAPIVEHVSSGSAYVDKVLVVPDQTVRRGDVLVRMTDPERVGATDDIRRDIQRAAQTTRDIRAVLDAHLQNETASRQALVETYQTALSKRRLTDVLGHYTMDETLRRLADLHAFDAGISTVAGDFHDIRRQLKRQLDDAKDNERRLKRNLRNSKASARAMDIIAQTDGTVREIFVLHDEYTPRGRTVVTVETEKPRRIQAWVNEARADAIFLGMETEIQLRNASGSLKLYGVVSDITAGIDAETDNGFGMIVTVTVPQFDTQSSRLQLRDGAPVKLRGLKYWAFWKGKTDVRP